MSTGQPREWLDRRHSALQYWGTQVLPASKLTPLRISLIYAVFGFAALYVSDVVFVRHFSEPFLGRIQSVKGGLEVVLTTGLIFVLTERRERQLQQSLEELDHRREELDVLHRVLRHNLRNDLCVIHGYTERIRDSLSSESLEETCEVVIDTVEQMTVYTEQASRINKLAQESGDRRPYDVVGSLPDLIDDHPQVTSEVTVSTRLPDHATVEVNSMFEEALQEVIANAIKHNDAEAPRVEITVRHDRGPPHMVEICIADNGPGIPHSEHEPIEAGQEAPLLHITGMGLWFVKWTITRSGGELTFEDNADGGTTVRMLVPKTPEMAVSSFLRGP